ncbi:MAG: hypothetical protein ACTSU0_06880 [Alphaproteobacteria bacterium]
MVDFGDEAERKPPPMLVCRDEAGRPVAQFGAAPDGTPYATFFDVQGNTGVAVKMTPSGPAIMLMNNAGKVRGLVTRSPETGSPALVIFGEDDTPIMAYNPDGDPS